ncbi:hypothetical protein Q4595_16665, partial [Wenyingzhuangia sp. 1_MG-2023]|nr:hypothetical protein [Wenyingzhuangia sp. 1_MG-2023]
MNTEAPLVISFSNAGEVTNPNHIHETSYSPWGYEYLCKKNLNVISFSCMGETTWYRNDLFIDFLESFALQLKKFRRKIGYGGSMGGYAVSAFANLLELDNVLLMNPISSLNTSSLVPWETRFASAANGLNWEQRYNDGANLNCKGMIVYDPLFDLDNRHAKRYKTLKHIHFPGVGHGIPKHLLVFR